MVSNNDDMSGKIIDFPDLRAAWICGNCKYFIQREEKDPNEGECHEGPTVPVTVEAIMFGGIMSPSPLSPEKAKVHKLVPQIVWMFRRTSKILTGCGRFQVKEKVS